EARRQERPDRDRATHVTLPLLRPSDRRWGDRRRVPQRRARSAGETRVASGVRGTANRTKRRGKSQTPNAEEIPNAKRPNAKKIPRVSKQTNPWLSRLSVRD